MWKIFTSFLKSPNGFFEIFRFSKVSGFDSFGKHVKTFVFSPIYMNLKINVKVDCSNMIFVNIFEIPKSKMKANNKS